MWIIGETEFTHKAIKYLRPLINNGRKSSNPTVVVVRTVSKSKKFQDLNNFKNKRRTFNKALQKMGERSSFFTMNIDEITPRKEIFESDGGLSPTGFNVFWNCINIEIKQNDIKRLQVFEKSEAATQVRHTNSVVPSQHNVGESTARHSTVVTHRDHRNRDDFSRQSRTRDRSRDRDHHTKRHKDKRSKVYW